MLYFSGKIGRQWAMLFASVGYEVKLYDSESHMTSGALDDILVQLESMNSAGILHGHLTVIQQHQCISAAQTLADCIFDAVYVQV